MLKRLLHFSAINLDKNLLNKIKMPEGKPLSSVIKVLEDFAPIALASNWDNVGLLVEPYKQRPIKKIILTNDLTESVMKESIDRNADMIISYHPPIFNPLKRITLKTWKERIISMCLSESIALYSPHTCWDSVIGGVNDWLSSALPLKNMKPIQVNEPPLPAGTGAGRIFDTDVTLRTAIQNVQAHIGLDVHVALGVNHNLDTRIKKVAVCAGSGSSLLKDVPADLYLTGEMSHHDILDVQHSNCSLILCNHSNSERGFLIDFCGKLRTMLDDECEVFVSQADEDPLKTHVKSS